MNTTTEAVSASPRAAGDRRAASATAIEAIYRAQAARFRGLAAAVAGADAASDVVQEAFARALRKRAYAEIAGVMGIEVGTVGALLSKAHAALRAELEREERQ